MIIRPDGLMKRVVREGIVGWLLASVLLCPAIAAKPRLLVLTDIGGDPDDQQALVRLLVHANEFQIEGLVASASGTPGELKKAVTRPELIGEMVDAYGQVWSNLKIHADGFPTADALRKVIKSGNRHRGRSAIGDGHDTQGSAWIIDCVDRQERRPLHVAIWGGQTDLAQALWRVRHDRGEEGYQRFIAQLRVFDIDDQDRIQSWLCEEFPDIHYILAKAQRGADKREGAYRGMYLGGEESLTSLAWLDEHVRHGHGPLGALYPPRTWTAPNPHGALKEGDSPSWLYLFPNGLGFPEKPEWGSWGGRYERRKQWLYRDSPDTVGETTDARATVWRWREAFQNEFAARMDWCVADTFQKANHPPVAVLNDQPGNDFVGLAAQAGDPVELSMAGSSDPDGDAISVRWFIYREASRNGELAELSADTGQRTTVTTRCASDMAQIHVIAAVTDNGSPPLTRYRRAIITVPAGP